jgi:hypothetical protein
MICAWVEVVVSVWFHFQITLSPPFFERFFSEYKYLFRSPLKLAFEAALLTAEVPRRSQAPRQRKAGGGRKPRLASVEDKLIYILFYFKCYPTFDLAGLLFGLNRSQANRWMHRLQPVLEEALGREMALPERKLSSIEEFVERFPGVKRVMVDGTERPIQRAKDREQQRENYSGKKKRHTRTHLAVVTRDRRVAVISKAYPGKTNDKGMWNREQWARCIPEDVEIQADSGFQGVAKEHGNARIPHKKPRGGELSPEQKEENRALASERVVCEHAFAGVKRYGIIHHVYRNRVDDFDDRSMRTAAGLWNFYLMAA